MLYIGKACFFAGPIFLKMGVNQLQTNPNMAPFMFVGYGLCYSGFMMMESVRNYYGQKIS